MTGQVGPVRPSPSGGDRPKRSMKPDLVIAVVTVLVLIGIAGWALMASAAREVTGAGTSAATSAGTSARAGIPPTSAPTVAGTETAVPEPSGTARQEAAKAPAACRLLARADRSVVAAGLATLDDWQVHIGAMNKLAAGAVPPGRLVTFLAQARPAAEARLTAFRAADRRAADLRQRCTSSAVEAAGPAGCAPSSQSAERSLAPARRAARTWGEQLRGPGPPAIASVREAGAAWSAVVVGSVRQLDAAKRALRLLGDRCRS